MEEISPTNEIVRLKKETADLIQRASVFSAAIPNLTQDLINQGQSLDVRLSKARELGAISARLAEVLGQLDSNLSRRIQVESSK